MHLSAKACRRFTPPILDHGAHGSGSRFHTAGKASATGSIPMSAHITPQVLVMLNARYRHACLKYAWSLLVASALRKQHTPESERYILFYENGTILRVIMRLWLIYGRKLLATPFENALVKQVFPLRERFQNIKVAAGKKPASFTMTLPNTVQASAKAKGFSLLALAIIKSRMLLRQGAYASDAAAFI